MKFQQQIEEKGLKNTTRLTGETVELRAANNPDKVLAEGEIIQAFIDANGIVQYVEIMRADGTITWEEVSQLIIVVLEKSVKWIPRIIAFFKKIFKSKSK